MPSIPTATPNTEAQAHSDALTRLIFIIHEYTDRRVQLIPFRHLGLGAPRSLKCRETALRHCAFCRHGLLHGAAVQSLEDVCETSNDA